MTSFTIHGPSIDLNTYINAERSNRFMAAKIKREEMDRIMWQLPMMHYEKINLTIQAYVKNKRKDPDNVYFFVKFLLDAMVKKGIIDNDGQKNIGSITLQEVKIGEERMEVTLTTERRS
jgi:Holliday junction resolvase RusA-like endonuclease